MSGTKTIGNYPPSQPHLAWAAFSVASLANAFFALPDRCPNSDEPKGAGLRNLPAPVKASTEIYVAKIQTAFRDKPVVGGPAFHHWAAYVFEILVAGYTARNPLLTAARNRNPQ